MYSAVVIEGIFKQCVIAQFLYYMKYVDKLTVLTLKNLKEKYNKIKFCDFKEDGGTR